MYWNKIKSEINQRHEYLFRLFAHSKNISTASKVPRILKISTALTADMAEGHNKCQRLAFLFPTASESALWIAVGAALALMKADFLPAIENLPAFSKGQRLILDNKWVVEFDGEEKINGQKFMWLKFKNQKNVFSSRKIFPVSERLRLQPTATLKQLTLMKNIPPQSSIPVCPLDQLIEIKSYGNRSIFFNRIVLVSRVGKTRDFTSNTLVSTSENSDTVPFKDLLQWGSIDIEGNIESWSSHHVEAEPVIAVASNLSGVREYFQSEHHVNPLIILNGSSSFLNNLGSFDDVLKTGYPVVSVMEQGEDEGIRLLSERSFKTWVWSENEIRSLELPNSEGHYYKKDSPFASFQRSIRNYAKRKIELVTCDDSLIQATAEKLNTLTRKISHEKPDTNALKGMLYGCLLPVARLVRPVEYSGGTEWKEKIEERFQRVESELFRNKLWLTEKEYLFINELISDLRKIFSRYGLLEKGKVKVLQELILAHTGGNIAVIVDNVEEKLIAENYWKSHLENIERVHFCGPNTINAEIDYKCMIICGWLGTDKMRLLYDSCLAPEIMILVYPFENTWLQSVMNKWKRNMIHGLHISEKAKLLNLDSADLPEDDVNDEYEQEPVDPDKDFDILEFELQLRLQRRTAFVNAVSFGEATTEAIQVDLSEDRFAFLTKSFKIAVVNDLLSGKATEEDEIPRKTVLELKTGDYVIFREGAESDLLREIAGRGLEKAGKQQLLKDAGLWKQALRNFEKEIISEIRKKKPYGIHRDYSYDVANKLKKRGCNRHPQTIRNWLINDDLIGPRSEKDLQIIADTTGDTELKLRLQDVRLAIKEVRGAHLQASRFLARKLIEFLPGYLKSSTTQTMTVEIEGIGNAVVAQVEYVAKEPATISTAKVNRLFMEEE